MKLLLDTHILLWALTDDERLSPKARLLIEDEGNDIYYSVVSPWEIELKHLRHPDQMRLTGEDLDFFGEDAGYLRLPIQIHHISALRNLRREEGSPKHQDPFDRMLIAQAASSSMFLLTHDERILQYTDPHIISV